MIVETGIYTSGKWLEVLEEVCPLSARMIVNPVSMRMENETDQRIADKIENDLQEA